MSENTLFDVSGKITIDVRGYVSNSRKHYENQNISGMLVEGQNFRGFVTIGSKTEWRKRKRCGRLGQKSFA